MTETFDLKEPPVTFPQVVKQPEQSPHDNNPTKGIASLYAKITAAMGEVQRIDKGNEVKNKDGKVMYKVASGDDLLDMVRPIMSKHRFLCIPNMDLIEKTPTPGDSRMINYRGYFTFTVADAETGLSFDRKWEAEVQDWSDKAINKVARIAERYFLSVLLQISTGNAEDDADISPSGGAPTKSAQTSQRKSSTRKTTKKSEPAKPDAKTATVKQIEVRKGESDKKPYIVAAGAVSWTRDPFRQAGIPCEDWTEPGTYDLLADAVIEYTVDDAGYKEIVSARWAADAPETDGAK